jgi:hypothetical protein
MARERSDEAIQTKPLSAIVWIGSLPVAMMVMRTSRTQRMEQPSDLERNHLPLGRKRAVRVESRFPLAHNRLHAINELLSP